MRGALIVDDRWPTIRFVCFHHTHAEDKLIHLDPHYCQDNVDTNQDNFSTSTFHCKSPRKLKLSKLDPSCCIGFYCKTQQDFDRFVETVEPFLRPARTTANLMTTSLDGCLPKVAPHVPYGGRNRDGLDASTYPMFSFSHSRSTDHEIVVEATTSRAMRERSMTGRLDGTDSDADGTDETEEFVIL